MGCFAGFLLQIVQIINIGLKGFTLNSKGQAVIVVFQILSINDWPDNLLFIPVNYFALRTINGSLSCSFAIAKVICFT